jgi:hypothetical protein
VDSPAGALVDIAARQHRPPLSRGQRHYPAAIVSDVKLFRQRTPRHPAIPGKQFKNFAVALINFVRTSHFGLFVLQKQSGND